MEKLRLFNSDGYIFFQFLLGFFLSQIHSPHLRKLLDKIRETRQNLNLTKIPFRISLPVDKSAINVLEEELRKINYEYLNEVDKYAEEMKQEIVECPTCIEDLEKTAKAISMAEKIISEKYKYKSQQIILNSGEKMAWKYPLTIYISNLAGYWVHKNFVSKVDDMISMPSEIPLRASQLVSGAIALGVAGGYASGKLTGDLGTALIGFSSGLLAGAVFDPPPVRRAPTYRRKTSSTQSPSVYSSVSTLTSY